MNKEHDWIIPLMGLVEDGSGSGMGQPLLILLSMVTVEKLLMEVW